MFFAKSICSRATFANIAAFLCLALASASCGKKDAKDEPEGPEHCTPAAFTPVEEKALWDSYHNRLMFSAVTSPSEPFDAIRITSYFDAENGAIAAGSYDLSGTTLNDCSLCVVAYRDCNGDTCERMFYANIGWVVLDDIGQADARFAGQFVDVLFSEITIDEETGEMVYLRDGESFCAHGFNFDLTVTAKVADAACVSDGTGSLLGDNVGDYSLINCNGDSVALHSRCGAKKAVRVLVVAGWCSACDAEVPKASLQYNSLNSRGYDLMVILGQDSNRNKPTLDYCLTYAEQHNIDPSLVFIDYGTKYGSWENTFTHINPYVSGDSFGIPWNALLNGQNMEYVYNDLYPPDGSLSATLSELLK